MRLLVLSDLHLELNPRWSLRRRWPDYDVAVCAGDIAGSIALSVAILATHPVLGAKTVIYVPGNHEYWDDRIDQAEQAGRWAAQGTDVRLLQEGVTEIGGVRFAGATLWTDYALDGDPVLSAGIAGLEMRDHAHINVPALSGDRPFMPGDAMALHARHRGFLEAALAEPFAGPTVVVTHHAPSAKSIQPAYAGDEANPAYASDLEDMIMARKPNFWIHGHVHGSCDYLIGETRIVANPKGYGPSRWKGGRFPKIENRAFRHDCVIEL